MLGSELWQEGSAAAPRGSAHRARGPGKPSFRPSAPHANTTEGWQIRVFLSFFDINSQLLLKKCTKSALLYPTDRKGCLKKEPVALHVGRRTRWKRGASSLTPSKSQRRRPVHFRRRLPSSEGTLSTVVRVRVSQTVRSGPRPTSCLQPNL